MKKYYKSNHDCFGSPTFVPDGYPLPDGPAGVPDDPRCPLCRIPLRAVTGVTDGHCTDSEACAARRYLLAEHGGAVLLSPEGVTRIGPAGVPNVAATESKTLTASLLPRCSICGSLMFPWPIWDWFLGRLDCDR